MTSPKGKTWLIHGNPIMDDSGRVVGVIESAFDITERKQAEEQVRASLNEKEVLLRELYHRTKNNMQVISSLITLQATHIRDKKALQAFKETKERITSMALVHQMLYQADDLSNIDFQRYISSLIDDLTASYSLNPDRVQVKLDLEKIFLPIEPAIHCGLIINEIVSNSLQYAFPEDRKGEINIVLHPGMDDEIELQIRDDGVGLPDEIDIENLGTLGLELIKSLIELQLQGRFALRRNNGTEYKITFKGPSTTAIGSLKR